MIKEIRNSTGKQFNFITINMDETYTLGLNKCIIRSNETVFFDLHSCKKYFSGMTVFGSETNTHISI